MKHIILIAVIIAVTSNLTHSQNSSIVYANGIKIVKQESGNNINRIIPVNTGNVYNQKIISEPKNDNINSFNWILKFTATGKVFKDVSFANTQVGFIVTELGSVYKSTNGGENLVSVVNVGFPYYWDGVHAVSLVTIVASSFNHQDFISH